MENFTKADNSLTLARGPAQIFTFHVLAVLKINGNETPTMICMHEAPLLYRKMHLMHHDMYLRAEWPETLRANRIRLLTPADVQAEVSRLKDRYNYSDGNQIVNCWTQVYGGDESDRFYRALEKIAQTYNEWASRQEVISDADVQGLMIALVPSEQHAATIRSVLPADGSAAKPQRERAPAGKPEILDEDDGKPVNAVPRPIAPASDLGDDAEDVGLDLGTIEHFKRTFANEEVCRALRMSSWQPCP